MPTMQQTPTIAPPSAPMLTLDNEPDDIPDPPLPASMADDAMTQPTPGLPPEAPRMAQEPLGGTTLVPTPATVSPLPDAFLPLAHGFCQYLQGVFGTKLEEAAIRMTKEVDLVMSEMATYTKGVMGAYAPTPTPYGAVVQAVTPGGFPLTLTLNKASAAELVEELGRLESWLTAQGYTAQEVAA